MGTIFQFLMENGRNKTRKTKQKDKYIFENQEIN